MSGEFARQNPKIAKRLLLDEFECKDPYVERLLEGFAYLAARVQYKMDSEFLTFSQSLMNSIYPQYYSSTPSCTIVQFKPDCKSPDLAKGLAIVKKGALLKSHPCGEEHEACKFKTTNDVTLFPIDIDSLKYNIGGTDGSDSASLSTKASIKLSLKTFGETNFGKLNVDNLRFYIRSPEGQFSMAFYEQVFANCIGILFQSNDGRKNYFSVESESVKDYIKQVGFDESESLFPIDKRTFEGHRLIREYFTFPQKFMFFDLCGLSEVVKKCDDTSISIVFLFDQSNSLLKNMDKANLCLFCSPAVNLFQKNLDRIAVTSKSPEYHIISDRTYPMDYEVIQIDEVIGYNKDHSERMDFLPFYADSDFDSDKSLKKAFFNYKRVQRTLSDNEKKYGARTSYCGTEMYISIVDTAAPPYKKDLEEIGVSAWCSNRDLSLLMNTKNDKTDFKIEVSLPITGIKCIESPTAPKMPFNVSQWRVLNNISVNFFSMLNENNEVSTKVLTDILKLYAVSRLDHDVINTGIISVNTSPTIRRVNELGPILFANGFNIEVTFDEKIFSGTGIFLLGSILDRFFGFNAPINSFTETAICSNERGSIVKWPIRSGNKQII